MPEIPVITVDGPGGVGKGELSRRLAEHLGWRLLDSGRLYRLLAYQAARQGVGSADIPALCQLVTGLRHGCDFREGRIFLDGRDVSEELATEESGKAASQISSNVLVRKELFDWQRSFLQAPGLVADGRDMGTALFPEAPLKVFLTASAEERARRRYMQLKQKGKRVNLRRLSTEMKVRDARDTERTASPLQAAKDAYILDTTDLDIDAVFAKVREAWTAVVAGQPLGSGKPPRRRMP